MKFFDEKTALDLEFDQIRLMLQQACITKTAKEKFQHLIPLRSAKKIQFELDLAHELQLIRNRGITFPRIEFEELTKEIRLLEIQSSVLELEGIVRVLDASRFVNALFLFFKEHYTDYFILKNLLQNAYYTKDIENAIEKILDKRLQVKDDASPDLLYIRQSIHSKRKQINRNFDKAVRYAKSKGYIDDISENVIDNRRVLTIISTYKRQVEGSILGSSKTGNFTYIEPKVNQILNRELDQFIDDEKKEIQRIFAALTNTLREFSDLIENYQRILVKFDFVNAKVKVAAKMNALRPEINFKNQDSYLKEAYHPLLFLKNKETGLPTVPQSFELKKAKRLLVISGPNAGGKSITLKTMGLLQIMFQSGLLIPLSSRSKMAFFDYILSDIGDNQSIENQLSTYSYRLQRMKFFLKKMGEKTLLLLDEFGTGSDPELGGALAEVFFETIYERSCYGVITTHYSNIKLKAAELPEAINANMMFNRATLAPEYQLVVGQPGSSFTFEVAQMNGIPHDMLRLAREKVDGNKLKFDKLIVDLQKEKSTLHRMRKESSISKRKMEESKEDYEEKSAKFDERLASQQQLIEKNNKYLNHGKKMSQFVQNYPSKSKAKQTAYLKEVKKYITIEKAKIEAAVKKAQEVERKKAEEQKAKSKIGKRPRNKKVVTKKPLIVGARVKLKNSRQSGEVMSIEANEATVAFGNLKAKVAVEKLIVL